jgi:drug/metabolite transporter (DMT)-like permease
MRRLLLLACIWGWSFLFIKVAVEGLTPPTVAWARIALGAVVLHLYLWRKGLTLPRDRTTWRHFTVAALAGSAIPFTMLAWGEERITSALTAVLNASTPLFTAVAAAVLLRDRLRGAQAIGLLVGLAGVAVAAGLGGADLAGSSVSGSLASVGAGACYGLSFAYMRKHLVGLAPVVAAAGQLTVATIALTPIALVSSVRDGAHVSPKRLLCLVLLGAIGTGVAYVLNYRIIAELGATKASLVTYVIPVVAVVVGIVVLGERFELRMLVGGLMIIGGIALVHSWAVRRPLPPLIGTVAVVLAVAALAAGCGGSGGAGATSRCGPTRRERLDPSFLVHVLPGSGPEPTYGSDPPTSGPHQPSPAITGAVDRPIARPIQVGILEAGHVLIQYRPDLAGPDVRALRGLARAEVVVAPNADLAKPIVATAWVYKRSCTALDLAPLRAFIAARVGKGPS